MGASSTAIPSIRWRRPTTGLLSATRARRTRTGPSSERAAADDVLGGATRPRLRRATTVAALTLLAVSLGRDAGPPRFTLAPTGFDRLQGWGEDWLSAAVPAFLKSCSRLLTLP